MAATTLTPDDTTRLVESTIAARADELRDIRRDLHANPELSWHEVRTTDIARKQVEAAGWNVQQAGETGFFADLGDAGPRVALRADLDALPVEDTTGDPWASRQDQVAHACGHDVHTTALIGASYALAAAHEQGRLKGRVRLIFQPAEEVMPGGALQMIDNGALEDVASIFMLHCDPSIDVGKVGLREGPLTGAADRLEVRLTGDGGHTSRPHLTQDVIFALGKVISEVPAVLSRRFDPRAGVSVVWGFVGSGSAHNVIPSEGHVGGTVRMLDHVAWDHSEKIVQATVAELVAPYGVRATVDYRRGVPPVVNEPQATELLGTAVTRALGAEAKVATAQSLGGEDFAWYLGQRPGAMARLGTRTPGGTTYDLHQGNLRIDEGAVALGARVLAEAALVTIATKTET